jgi:hypothetical protein
MMRICVTWDVLLVLLNPRKTLRLGGREHGRAIPLPDIAWTLSDHLRWGAGQPSEPVVWRGLLFVVLGLSLLLLLEPPGQPQPHLRHVG